MEEINIGIDLAWGEKNFSGFCALKRSPHSNKLQIIQIKLLLSLDEIIKYIVAYKDHKILVGIDAPLLIPNDVGNREIEKNFNKDFSKYKISMLPVNRNLMTKHTSTIRSEELFKKLQNIGFQRDFKSDKVVYEVYPHATIAMCFNSNQILPYKRKKGRDTQFIKEQLIRYQKYLLNEIESCSFLEEDITLLKGKKLKDYEDILDAITSAYTLYYCKYHSYKSYTLDGVETFITPVSKT